MCIAVAIPSNVVLYKKTLKHCWEQNPDGGGIMFSDGERVRTFKVLDDYDRFEKLYFHLANGPALGKNMVVHCRVATHGNVNRRNCHPHRINQQLAFVHNGTIHNVDADKDKGDSDTVVFRNEILSQLGDTWKNKGVFTMMEKFIGKSKLVFLDADGEMHIANESMGEWNSGVWFSNDTYYKPRVKRTVTTYNNYPKTQHKPPLIKAHHNGKNSPVIATEEHFDKEKLEWKPQRFISQIPLLVNEAEPEQTLGNKWIFDRKIDKFRIAKEDDQQFHVLTEDQIWNVQCSSRSPLDKGRGFLEGWCKRFDGSWKEIGANPNKPAPTYQETEEAWRKFASHYSNGGSQVGRMPCDACGYKVFSELEFRRGTCSSCHTKGLSPADWPPKKAEVSKSMVILPPTPEEIFEERYGKDQDLPKGVTMTWVPELMGYFKKSWVTKRYPNGVFPPKNILKKIRKLEKREQAITGLYQQTQTPQTHDVYGLGPQGYMNNGGNCFYD